MRLKVKLCIQGNRQLMHVHVCTELLHKKYSYVRSMLARQMYVCM